MHARPRRRAIATIGAACIGVACARGGGSAPRSEEAGQLPTSFYAGGADCAGTPQFRVYAYNADFFILRQAACTNYEKPFLYLLVGHERALLLDTGAGQVDVATPVDTLIRAWLTRHGRAGQSMALVV